MKKVLIVEDSAVVRDFLTYILSADDELRVIGTAKNGEEAVKFVSRNRPDVITMDINMPRMDGIEATMKIMETVPTPIVIVTASHKVTDVDTAVRAMKAGALAVVERPMGMEHPDHERSVQELIKMVKLMSEVKVVTRRPSKREKEPALKGEEKVSDEKSRNIKVVAVGASTGGPAVLHDILIRLSPNIAAPILVVQHISTGFVHGLVNWLQEKTSLSVRVAQHGEALVPGHVYFAPDGCQMGVDSNERILLDEDRPYYGMCPSASYLFRSVSKTHGKNAVGVLLTGMGKDGAEELLLMKEKGAVTIVQDRESSVVHGMPGEAIRLEAAEHVLAPADIAGMLEKIVGRR